MKKHLIIFVITCLVVTCNKNILLAQTNTGSAIKTVELIIKRGGTAPNCNDYGICHDSPSLITNNNNIESVNNHSTMFLNHYGNLIQKIWKENLSEELQADFLGQNMYYVKQETSISEDIKMALGTEKALVIIQGWHILTELDDCYVISYTLKH